MGSNYSTPVCHMTEIDEFVIVDTDNDPFIQESKKGEKESGNAPLEARLREANVRTEIAAPAAPAV